MDWNMEDNQDTFDSTNALLQRSLALVKTLRGSIARASL